MQQPHCPHKNRQITVYREVPEVLLLREATLESTSEWDAQLACAMSWKCEDCGYEESHQDWRKADPATRQIYQQARSFVAMDDPFPLSALQEEAVPLATKTPHSPGAITLVREDDLAILYERGHLKVSAWRLSGPSGKRFRKPRLTPVGNWQVL